MGSAGRTNTHAVHYGGDDGPTSVPWAAPFDGVRAGEILLPRRHLMWRTTSADEGRRGRLECLPARARAGFQNDIWFGAGGVAAIIARICSTAMRRLRT